MSLTLNPTRAALGFGVSYAFGASSGTSPYTYSVLPGGVGGSIDSSGVYTAPSKKGEDLIQARDSAGKTVQSTILVGGALELFCDVIQQEMGLDDGRVYLWNQKVFEPVDPGLFIAVSMPALKAFGNTNTFDPTLGQVQSANMRALLDVNIISRDTSAIDRKEEVLMALASQYSQNQQGLNGFRIFPVSNNFANITDLDGTAILYRFAISVAIQYFVTKAKTVPYFNTFSAPTVATEP